MIVPSDEPEQALARAAFLVAAALLFFYDKSVISVPRPHRQRRPRRQVSLFGPLRRS